MTRHAKNSEISILLLRAAVRLRAVNMAVVVGITSGCSLFLATAWLLMRGGEDVGKHLALLSAYFPGYSVTWAGAFVGFAYGGLVGSAIGWIGAAVYNWVAFRQRNTGSPNADSP